jgi:hypothetical protein
VGEISCTAIGCPRRAKAVRASRGIRLDRQRAEPLSFFRLHHASLCETSGAKGFCDSPVGLSRMPREAKGDPAAKFHYPTNLPQACLCVRPDLHRVDRQRLVEALVIERQAFHGTVLQIDATSRMASAFRTRACATISRDGSMPAT